MSVTLENGRVVNIGDSVELIGSNWFTDKEIFEPGSVILIVPNTEGGDFYLNRTEEGKLEIEIEGVEWNPGDFA